jgi:cytochrome c-type biogenesis protein CcmE
VTFAEARTAKGAVQVRGTLVGNKASVAADGKMLTFTLRDEASEEVSVVYAGAKPEGLEQATSIVAIGKYQNSQFTAEKLLVKCPSKYQGSVKQ